ncbi:hypothetical protein [Kiloniella antarctica]|uniref:Uncharacterized protein n=1 Tax=Kiloniella antarctica TaxID=1550907 RepID=A0ABW5BMB1_9PROT
MSKVVVKLSALLGVVCLLVIGAMSISFNQVYAQETSDTSSKIIVKISREDCTRLIKHHPADDVTYVPGVTKRGKKVVPADLNAQPITLPDVIRIPITVDLFERYNIPANKANFGAEAEIGVVEVYKNGRSFFNGQPLQSEEQRELAIKCQEIVKNEE